VHIDGESVSRPFLTKVMQCLADNSIIESSVSGALKIDPRHRPEKVA
jgi:hypothetical protein